MAIRLFPFKITMPGASTPDRDPRLANRRPMRSLLLVFALFLLPDLASAQAVGDYRTRASGDFSDPNIWETYFWGTWWPNVGPPDINDGVITITSGTTVNLDVSGSYDQMVIENGATLNVTQTVSFVDGAGTDLDVYGTLNIDRTSSVQGTASAIFRNGSSVNMLAGDRLFFRNDSQGTFEAGSNVDIASNGRIVIRDDSVVDMAADVQINSGGRIVVRDRAATTVSGGTINNEGLIRVINQSSMAFGSGATYIHDRNGDRLPTASRTTWDAGSNVIISGLTNNLPANLNDTFGNFTWDNPSQSGDLDLNGRINAIEGDFTINDTGSGALIWDGSGGGSSLDVAGDFTLNGGEFIIGDGNTSSIAVDGNASIGSGSTLTLGEGGGDGTLTVDGNLDLAGDVNTTGGGSGTIDMNGSTPQNISQTGSTTGDVNLSLSGSGGVTASTDLSFSGSITETAGGLDMGGNALTLGGDLNISTSLTNVDSIEFTGTNSSVLTLPAGSQSVNGLTVDKPGSDLTLGSDLTITGYVIVRDGTFNDGGFTLTLAEGATFYSDQPWTGTVTVSRTYSQNSDGWRMIASPVDGVNYSDLNGAFLTQGGAWADSPDGTSNLQAFNFLTQDWSPLSGADATMGAGTGYILYAFAEDDLGASILPTTWTVTGQPGALSSQALSYSGDPASSYNLVGNPSTVNLDWDLTVLASSNIGSSYATWDPSGTTGGGTSGYQYYDEASGTGSAGRYIAPFTAFMVQATGAGSSLAPTTSEAAATQTPVQYGKRSGPAPHFVLSVTGEALSEPETILSFGAEATDESGLFDVHRLAPLSTQFVTLWSADDERRLAFDGRTMQEGREIYDLVLATTRPGQYTLRTGSIVDIPEHWNARLIDLRTGNEMDLLAGDSLRFHTVDQDVVTADRRLSESRSPRFRVIIEDPDRFVGDDTDWTVAGNAPVLSQNYPNPFNPITTIRFSLPESAPVRLEVFDMLGRRVSTLIDGTLSSGWHESRFDANTLSSGMYLYRLSVAGQQVTRSMLLLR